MKKYIYILLACAAVFSFAACVENVEINPDENGPVLLNVSMEQPETKATISEAGAFAFSNGDAIKVYSNENSKVFTGTTTSTGNDGTFAMEAGFKNEGTGFAGFPASLVKTISGSGVTFVLPANYEYAEVGSADPDAAMVPCPMIGSFDASSSSPMQLMQAGAVVRLRVTNIAAGSLSFTFPTKVTGQVTLTTPSGTDDGILAANLTLNGNTITVSDVPAVTSGNYIYITLPVPTATAPQEILVINTPDDPALAIRMQSLTGSSTALNRRGGYKMGVAPAEMPTPTFTVNTTGAKVILAPGNLMAQIGAYADGKATASAWKFGGYIETVGNAQNEGNYLLAQGSADCVGKWVDLFCWQGESTASAYRAHGLINLAGDSSTDELIYQWHGNVADENVYDGCWNNLTITNGTGYTWRSLTADEWNYIIAERETSTLNGVANARHARVSVCGINGVLLFPDNIGSVWNTTTMGAYPSDINNDNMTRGSYVNYVWGTDNYTSDNMVAMVNVGVVFMPCTGYRSGTSVPNSDTFLYYGYYWTGTGSPINNNAKQASYFRISSRDMGIEEYKRYVGRAVRLVRDLVNVGNYDTWNNDDIDI